jgi:hypothetical protein
MYHSAIWDEPLLNELHDTNKEKYTAKSVLPESLQKIGRASCRERV